MELTKKEMEAKPFRTHKLRFKDDHERLKEVYLQVCSELLDFEIFSENIALPNPKFIAQKGSEWGAVDNYIPMLRIIKKQIHKRLMLAKLEKYNSRFDPTWAMKEIRDMLGRAETAFAAWPNIFSFAHCKFIRRLGDYVYLVLNCKTTNGLKKLYKEAELDAKDRLKEELDDRVLKDLKEKFKDNPLIEIERGKDGGIYIKNKRDPVKSH